MGSGREGHSVQGQPSSETAVAERDTDGRVPSAVNDVRVYHQGSTTFEQAKVGAYDHW